MVCANSNLQALVFRKLWPGLILYHNCDVVLVTELLWKNFVKSAAEDFSV